MKNLVVLIFCLLISNICVASTNQFVNSPFHSTTFVQTQWKGDLYFPIINKEIRTTLDVKKNTQGKLSLQINFADSDQCLGQLHEDKVYNNGYMVRLSSNPDTSCQSDRVSRGYLYFYYPLYKSWPLLQLFNDKGEMVAQGSLGGIKGGLPGINPKLAAPGAEKKIKAMENEIALAKLQAIDPQTIFTQCRILEIKWKNQRGPEWCLCLDEQYQEILSLDEYAAAVKDYLSFRRMAGKTPEQFGDWRYMNAQNHCRECKQKNYKGGCLQNDNKTPNGKNYTRILNVLLKGDYDSIEKNILFKNFFIDYIHAYSDWCGKNDISSGVIRRRISWEEDQNGYQIGHTQEQEVIIDSDYIDTYDRYLTEVNRDDIVDVLSKINPGDPGKFMDYSVNKVMSMISTRLVLNNHLNGGCMSTSVQKVYKSILKFDYGAEFKGTKRSTNTTNTLGVSAAPKTKPSSTGTHVSDSLAAENQLQRLINLQESFKVKFPDELMISVQIYDFLLARYYPHLLNQRILEAMLSSRWSYERSQKNPLGGRFFNPDSRPWYKDIQGVTQEFREWLISRAAALPEELVIDVPLQYGQNTMSVNDRCTQLIMSKDAAVRVSQQDKEEADRKVRKCEDGNRNLEQVFESCERARGDLEQARHKLAHAEAGGCMENNNDNTGRTDFSDGPCDFSNLTMANMKTEMKKCLNNACGTPSASTDMIDFQKCAQAVTEQFRNEISRLMGQAPRQQTSKKEDSCQTARKKVQAIEQHLARYRCDLMPQKPELFDCASKGLAEQPDYMHVERIELSHMQNCIAADSAYNRRSKSSAELLPSTQPYTDTRFGFVLFVDKLALPYDLPLPSKGQWTNVKARIKLAIKAADKSLNRLGQLGLAAEVKSLEWTD